MQATQPIRTFQPALAGLAGLVAAALFVAAVIAASVLPSIAQSGAPAGNAGSGFVPVRHDFYTTPVQGQLKLDPDARDGGAGIHPSVPR